MGLGRGQTWGRERGTMIRVGGIGIGVGVVVAVAVTRGGLPVYAESFARKHV